MEFYLAIVLNAHAPYLKHPHNKYSLDEYLLFDQILDTYLPLLEMLERLQSHIINTPITLSLSPTLLEMLASPIIQEHFRIYLQYKINLAKFEKERNFFDSQIFPLADYYWQLFSKYQEKFIHTYKSDLIGAFANLHHKGIVNLITTCATSAILPLLYPHSSLTRTQIKLGLDTFKRFFGFYPQDFWLPECAYNPGLEKILQDCGLKSTHISSCSAIGSTPSVPTSPYSPLRSLDDFIFYPN
ncbi:DUF1957 domain-containing protein, partial [bacterium]|nr:DUF1957 domain-containing protein [bacterium]